MGPKMLILVVVFSLVLFLGFPCPAYAYIDPGTGSYFLQFLLAGLLGLLYVTKIYWAKLKQFLASRLFPGRSGPRPGD